MLKEFILAIILGALLGFGLTGGYFALNTNKKNASSQIPTPLPVSVSTTPENETSPQPTPKLISTTANVLTIDSPQNESIVNNSKITIVGKSSPKSIIIVTTSKKTYSLNNEEDGSFSVDVDLDSGANQINISAIDAGDTQSDVQLIITYSTAKI